MFVVWIAALITTISPVIQIVLPDLQRLDPSWFDISVAITIWITLFFATFAESMSKNRRQMYEDRFKLNLLERSTVTLITDKGKREKVSTTELNYGDLIEVGTGEIIPCNGMIKEGEARVDESSITGTFDEQIKNYTHDNEVHAGSQIVVGRLMIEVNSVPQEQDISEDINKIERTSTLTEKSLYIFLRSLTFIFVVTSFSIAHDVKGDWRRSFYSNDFSIAGLYCAYHGKCVNFYNYHLGHRAFNETWCFHQRRQSFGNSC
jgi:K+-transporting ATPase ATPase B chain